MSYLQDEFNKFLNAESCYFYPKELRERKERIIELFLIIYGLILSYSLESDLFNGYVHWFFFILIISILFYYSILPSSFVNDEFRFMIRLCATIIAGCFSFALILIFSSNITEYTWEVLLTLSLMLLSIFVLILRLLYV